jgi:hypothetical protein
MQYLQTKSNEKHIILVKVHLIEGMTQIHNKISTPPKPWFILIIVARPKESNNYFTTHLWVLQPFKTLK